MTVNELKTMDCATITPDTAAKVLRCDPHYIRVAARKEPCLLGFPTVIIGNRVKIPRMAFIRFLEGGEAEV